MVIDKADLLHSVVDDLVAIIASKVADRVCQMLEERIAVAAQASTGHRLLRIAAVREKTGLSTSTIYRKIQHGMFPRQVDIGGTAATWLEADIDAWIEGRRTGRH